MDIDLFYARRDLVRGIASDSAMAEWARHYGVALVLESEQAQARESALRDFVEQIALLDPSLGLMDLHELVAEAREVAARYKAGSVSG